MTATGSTPAQEAARHLFHEALAPAEELADNLQALAREGSLADLNAWLNFVESDESLWDADKLAFKDPLELTRD